MKPTYLIFFLLYFLVFIQDAKAQDTKQTIELLVVNEEGHFINDAYLINQSNGNFIGVTFQGKISFKAQLPLKLTISHISYQNQTITIDSLTSKALIEQKVTLKTAITSLEEVQIQAEKSDLAYQKKTAYVEDYVFYENAILLLLGVGNKRTLRLIDEGSSTLYEQVVFGKDLSLLMDCFNNIHLKSKDSIHQVFFTDSSFSLMKAYPIEAFNNTLDRCKASLNQNIVLAYQGENQQEIHYFLKEKEAKDYKTLRKIRDLKAQMGFNYFENKYEQFKENGLSAASSNSLSDIKDVRALDRAFTYYKYVMTKPLYCPIFSVDNSLLLFDHFNNKMLYYDVKGNQLDSVSIEYHLAQDWNHQLLQDYYTKEIYAVFERGHLLEIKKMDLKLGEPTQLSVKSKKRFPIKLRIRDQKLYYLQRDMYKAGLPQQLFVIDIK